ncbi:hypothetical protein [Streptomyces lavendulocolor]|uniref:hypothetical protein n=1 Tax=Streptomyces lavendulocolor TaxID=67316 RepID=UPI0033C98C1E
MTCPHCARELRQKERTGNVCSYCGRAYALDPKTNPLRLHDLRVRRVVGKLTQEGRITITPGQLWYALSRRQLAKSAVTSGCVMPALFAGLVTGVIGMGGDLVFLRVVSGALVLLTTGLVLMRLAGVGKGALPQSREAFRTGPLAEWEKRYGTLPAGMVDDRRFPRSGQPAAAGSRAVLLCPDPSVAAFLAAGGLPARYGVVLAEEVRKIPALCPEGPVVVLHDADARGHLLVREARETLPGRPVIDAGVALRSVDGMAWAVPYRDRRDKPDSATMARLGSGDADADAGGVGSGDGGGRGGGLTPKELKRLADGWRFPLVGVPPARLLAVVTRIVERTTAAVDPERRRAASVGFMTWPPAPGPAPAGER